ncbi:MAG: SDR family NAD(P)-dependent oxidoreductase [Planctomycetota bacterium]
MITFDFSGKVILLTGGSGGIGLVTAKLFVQAGAKVFCADLKAPTEPVPNVHFFSVDVSHFQQVQSCIETILAQEKAIDCLINNAGISKDAPIWKMTETDWDQVLDVNLKGAFNFIHHLAPHFRQKNSGKIVNVSSINGLRGKFGLANYSASKAGLIGLTKTIAKELGRHQVNVNAVAPGYVRTPLTQTVSEKIMNQALEETVLGRLAEPEDIAHTILFLCSPLASHITGEVIKVDGGQYI